jgi:predicted dehydrogenase
MVKERALVVGAGGISGSWFGPLIDEGVEVVGVVDINPENARAKLDKFKLAAPVFTDLRKALRKVQADFAVDLTVPEAHCQVTCAALKAGLHVIGEKPMAASMAQARRMVAAADKAGKLYMVSQSRRWDPKHELTRRLIASDAIGQLSAANCQFYIGAHFGGFRAEMPSPLILDMAIHHFDMARHITCADPVSVYARQFNPSNSWYKGDVAATCIFEMTGGLFFTYMGSWCAEGCMTSWNGDWRFQGAKGSLLMEADKPPRGQVVIDTPGKFIMPQQDIPVPAPDLKFAGMHGALREMLAFLREGTLPQTHCHDNIKSLAMVFAAIESSRKGKPVPVRAM